MKIEYDEYMDKECIELCDAINSIDGLQTIESCCGHGERPIWIWFLAKHVKNLMTIGRILDNRYSVIDHDWKCEIDCTDGDAGVLFFLHSGSSKGQKAYDEAVILAENIRQHLIHPAYMEWYNSIPNVYEPKIKKE